MMDGHTLPIRWRAAATLALALGAVTLGGVAARAQDRAPSCHECDATRDAGERYQALMMALAHLQAKQEALKFELASLDDDEDSARVADLQARRKQLREQETQLRQQLRALERERTIAERQPQRIQGRVRAGRIRGKPDGYLGVNLSGSVETSMRDGAVWYYFGDYPVVESVEPGSPALRAGLATGDVLLALDNRDLKGTKVAMSELLEPGRELPVRVKRDGQVRALTITVGRRPSAMLATTPDGQLAGVMALPPLAPDAPASPPTSPAPPARASTPESRRPSVWAVAPPTITMFGNVTGLAGAQVARLSAEMGNDYFGVDSGVLVLGVGEGTPAARAGLKGGDVIVRAGDASVATPAQLQRALIRANEDGRLELKVVRKRKTQTVTLEWER
jgi:C-terminal processing protease CtpA/Prc